MTRPDRPVWGPARPPASLRPRGHPPRVVRGHKSAGSCQYCASAPRSSPGPWKDRCSRDRNDPSRVWVLAGPPPRHSGALPRESSSPVTGPQDSGGGSFGRRPRAPFPSFQWLRFRPAADTRASSTTLRTYTPPTPKHRPPSQHAETVLSNLCRPPVSDSRPPSSTSKRRPSHLLPAPTNFTDLHCPFTTSLANESP